jgi:Mg-chelatase subunit ChlD
MKHYLIIVIVTLLGVLSHSAEEVKDVQDEPETQEAGPATGGDNSLAKDAKYSEPVENITKMKGEQSALVETAEMTTDNKGLPRVEVIVDSSGSMGQMLNLDKTKMFYMKKMLLRYFTDQYKVNAETGLRVYGSQKVGDCTDNIMAVPFGEKSLGQIETKVSQLQPVGKTPLYKAVKAAAEDLKDYKAGPKRIVIFTDGEDTCGGNPCKEGNAAKLDPLLDTQIFIVAIGYKPNSDDLKKISCMGDTTTANSEDDLFSALGNISQKIFQSQINLAVNSPDPTAPVQLFHQVNGEWKFFRNFTAAFGTSVPPGRYQAVVMLEPPYKFEDFEVPPKRKVTLTVRGNGAVKVEFLDKILDVEILDKNYKLIKKFKSDTKINIPTGRWVLKIHKQPFFEKFVQKYDVHPNGDYHYEMTGVGALKVVHKDIMGLYVYDYKNNLLGNYLTNFSFALPIGSYKIHVGPDCSFDKVEVKDDKKLAVFKCP